MVAPVSSEPVRLLIKKDFCGKKTSADIINVSLARKTTWEPPFIIDKNNQSKVTFIIIIISICSNVSSSFLLIKINGECFKQLLFKHIL